MDIITDGIVDLDGDESAAEARFEEILEQYEKYGKNAATTRRYFAYHREIQDLIRKRPSVSEHV